MKTIYTFALFAVLALLQPGCSTETGVSVGHDSHTHGVSMGGHANSSGVGASAGVR